MISDSGLDVIVRFHNTERLHELDRAVFSLAMQAYRPLHIHIVTQRFSLAEITTTKAALAPILRIENGPELSVQNWTDPEPSDARSALANLGMASASRRFLAFLDYDDTLYPEAYAILTDKLRDARCAIAFGGICVKHVDMYPEFAYTSAKECPFSGTGLLDLFAGNFCPIHSFVIDRARVPSYLLSVEPLFNRNEDYDLLLRICAQCPANFDLVSTIIGEYRYKSDGSNTIQTSSAATPENAQAWEQANAFIETRRRTTVISASVQLDMGIKHPLPDLTIRDLLDRGLDDVCSGAVRREERSAEGLDSSCAVGGEG